MSDKAQGAAGERVRQNTHGADARINSASPQFAMLTCYPRGTALGTCVVAERRDSRVMAHSGANAAEHLSSVPALRTLTLSGACTLAI